MTASRRSPKRAAFAKGDALVIIDVINDLDFSGGPQVLPWAARLCPRLKRFRSLARRKRVPVIYVNDNFGLWQSSLEEIVRYCSRKGALGRKISSALKPGRTDYFIVKPRHSGFFSTALLPLLHDLRVRRIILAGISTNLCVMFTAHDAYMHRFKLVVLSDCCAAESDFDHNVALRQLKQFCKAAILSSVEFADAKNRRSTGRKRGGRTAEGKRSLTRGH